MSLSELRERFEKTKKKLLLSLLKQIREDSDDPFLSGLSQKELLSQLLNDICALGVGSLFDQVTPATIRSVCLRGKVPIVPGEITEEAKGEQQAKLEDEINKRGFEQFLKKMTVKILRALAAEIRIEQNQTAPQLIEQLSEEIVLLGTENFLDLLPQPLLHELGEFLRIEAAGNKDEVVEQFMTQLFDLAPLEVALQQMSKNANAPLPKDDKNDEEEAPDHSDESSASDSEQNKPAPSSKKTKEEREEEEEQKEEEEEEEEGEEGEEEKEKKEADSGKDESSTAGGGKGRGTKGIKGRKGGKEGKVPIAEGVTRADLQKYTVPELRSYLKENFVVPTDIIKFKKDQVITYLLDKMEERANKGKKRSAEKTPSSSLSPPEKRLKR